MAPTCTSSRGSSRRTRGCARRAAASRSSTTSCCGCARRRSASARRRAPTSFTSPSFPSRCASACRRASRAVTRGRVEVGAVIEHLSGEHEYWAPRRRRILGCRATTAASTSIPPSSHPGLPMRAHCIANTADLLRELRPRHAARRAVCEVAATRRALRDGDGRRAALRRPRRLKKAFDHWKGGQGDAPAEAGAQQTDRLRRRRPRRVRPWCDEGVDGPGTGAAEGGVIVVTFRYPTLARLLRHFPLSATCCCWARGRSPGELPAVEDAPLAIGL